MPMKQQEIMKTLEEHTQELQKYRVKRLGLFGSYARGENTDKSDLDFVVEFKEKTFDNYMDLKFYLETLFGHSVDLVLENTIKPRLRPAILSEALYAQGL